jgi:DNA invertase Pin-like site-specific DNA recombinase
MITAVAYVRMSFDKQEASPKQQREEITKLAKREGYRVIRWCTDEAISGDATEKRVQFQQMIEDAESGEFQAILAWDMDRFGQFDSIEAGHWIYPLRKAGVCLVTVAQGKIDWHDFTSRIVYSVQQEAKHALG